MSNATAISVMRYALQQYHYTESPPGSNRTKFGKEYGENGQPWCSIYEWCCGEHGDGDNPIAKADNAGDIQDWTVSKKGGSWVMHKTKSNKTKAEGMKKAKFGDIASFDFGANDMWRDHTALYVGHGYFIEGNTSFDDKGDQDNGGAVALRNRPSNYICSYARPKYKKQDFYKPTTPYMGKIPKLPKKGYFEWGDKSEQVLNLQDALRWANGYKIKSDKEIGSITFAEIVIFQVANDLVPDGQFGEKCLAKLKAIIDKLAEKKPQETQPVAKPAEKTPKHPKLFIATNGDLCYDLSAWQGPLSVDYFKGIKKKGVKCVILRSSFTRGREAFSLDYDKYFAHNVINAAKAGLHIGIYHFSQARTEAEAKKEATFCLKAIEPYIEYIDLPVAFDWEPYERLSAAVMKQNGKTKNTAIAAAFCNKVKKAGYEPMVYASLTVFNHYLSAGIHKTWKIWVAQYYSKCQYKHDYYMWQFTSNNGKLDESRYGKQDTKKVTVKTDDGAQTVKVKTVSEFPERGYFTIGDTGETVKEIQRLLNKKLKGAFLIYPKLTVTGVYDEKTARRVKLFQDIRHLEIDGKVGKYTLPLLRSATVDEGQGAVNFAVAVARSNKFAYGVGSRAHRGGCPFCGTNTGPKKKKKEKIGEPHYVDKNGKKWKEGAGTKYTYTYTYCCNPFGFSAYAHGAGIEQMLKLCKAGRNATTGMDPKRWAKYGFKYWKCKDMPYSKLKVGDVVMFSRNGKGHVWIYTGDGWLVEACKGDWSKESIAHKKIAKKRYEEYQKIDTAYVARRK